MRGLCRGGARALSRRMATRDHQWRKPTSPALVATGFSVVLERIWGGPRVCPPGSEAPCSGDFFGRSTGQLLPRLRVDLSPSFFLSSLLSRAPAQTPRARTRCRARFFPFASPSLSQSWKTFCVGRVPECYGSFVFRRQPTQSVSCCRSRVPHMQRCTPTR